MRSDELDVRLVVNDQIYDLRLEPRTTLVDALREHCRLTGTHIGCEHGACGACTVVVDGSAVRACLIFAYQAEGAAIQTIEGLATAEGALHPIQEAFREAHALQCGFCTPGMVMTVVAMLAENDSPSQEQIRSGLSGNLCRCTGYQAILTAVELAASSMTDER
jgi:carbon-monoxide dehydrogenase small subunit